MGKLSLEHLEKQFEDVTAVDHVTLTVEDGEFVTVVGPSGCGKTTLLRMIAGFTEPSHGRISIDGDVLFDDVRGTENVPPEKRDIGMVFQTYAVWPHMNVFNNVAYPLKLRRISRAEIRERTAEALRLVHLGGFEKRMAFEMSGGQQQRVALARALVMEPRLLLLDEPFSNLDAVLREEMQEEVKLIQKKTGVTIINVTHDQAEAMKLSDRVAVMRDGKLIQYDTPKRIYELPADTFVAGFIGKANILPAARMAGSVPDSSGNMAVTVQGDAVLRVPFVRGDAGEGFVSFRSHEVRHDERGTITGEVRDRQYLGNGIKYILTLGDGARVEMLTSAAEALEIGEIVPLVITRAVWLDR